MRFRTPATVFLLALLATSGGYAGESLSWGIQAGLADAQGDFRGVMGSKLALDAGILARIPLTTSLSVRPTLEFQRFPALDSGYSYHSTRYNDLGNERDRWSAWIVGADMLYRPANAPAPVYFLVGASLKMWRVHSYGSFTSSDKTNGTQSYSVDDTDTRDEPALSLGIGYALSRHAALETRMTFANYRKQAYNTLHLSLVLNL
jgi:hypothetical protein